MTPPPDRAGLLMSVSLNAWLIHSYMAKAICTYTH